MGFKMNGWSAFTKTGSTFTKRTYAEAKAIDPKLDEYIEQRKNYKAGSKEYEALQAKINAAYGTIRSEEMKKSQIKRHKDDDSRTGNQNVENENVEEEYTPQTVKPKEQYDPASRDEYEYIPMSQR